MPLLERFRVHLASLAPLPGPALVAVSGGADSLALLDLLVATRAEHGLELVAGHVDHGIAIASGRAAELAQSAAERYSIPFEIERLALGAGATETRAREHRYAALRRMAGRTGAASIVTAHHADDQAETVVMRLLRGSGPAGLAAMRVQGGGVIRPLLPFRRSELARYLHEQGIEWWEDPANADARHLRSWLRADVMPLLEARLPDLVPRLQVAATQASRAGAAWDALLDALPDLELRVEEAGVSVAAHAVAGYDSALGEAIVAAVARRAGRVVGPARAARLVRLAAEGRSGTSVPLGTDWLGEVTFGRLLIRRAPPEPSAEVALEAVGEARWGRWRFSITRDEAPDAQPRGGMTAWFPDERFPDAGIIVRASQPGDRIVPLGGPGHRLLVRCFQDARVPRLSRRSWPVLLAGGSVVWVPGVCRAEALVPPAGSEAMRVDVTYE